MWKGSTLIILSLLGGLLFWIPACAGMTNHFHEVLVLTTTVGAIHVRANGGSPLLLDSRLRGNDEIARNGHES